MSWAGWVRVRRRYVPGRAPAIRQDPDRQRVGAWINPWAHYSSYGYQTVQGEFALGRGGLTGSGVGLGTPYDIPVAYSDFIFAAIGRRARPVGHDSGGRRLLARGGPPESEPRRGPVQSSSQLAAVGFTAILGFQSFLHAWRRVRRTPTHRRVTTFHRIWRLVARGELRAGGLADAQSLTKGPLRPESLSG